MAYNVTKTYGPTEGLSCCFRQWRAEHSHCSKLHGYALGFRFTFSCKELNYCQWVVDFGGLFKLKQALKNNFDHKTIIARDDPLLLKFMDLHELGGCDLLVLDSVGNEMFAEHAYKLGTAVLKEIDPTGRVSISAVECFEHEGNAAIYLP